MLRSLLDQEPCGRTGNGSLTHLSKENSGTMCDGKILFTVAEDEKLVKIIPKYPCIYDVSVAQYKDQSLKDNAWKEIAEIIGRPEDDCKKRWRNIRDTWLKRQKKGKSTGSSGKKNWPLADLLTFLNKVENKRENTSNVQNGETLNQEETMGRSISPNSSISSTKDSGTQNVEDTPLDSPTKGLSNKRPRRSDKILQLLESRRIERQTILKRITEGKGDDDVDLFFKSIAKSVKKLRPNLINEAKMRSLEMVIELENRNSSPFYIPEGRSDSPTVDSKANIGLNNTEFPIIQSYESV